MWLWKSVTCRQNPNLPFQWHFHINSHPSGTVSFLNVTKVFVLMIIKLLSFSHIWCLHSCFIKISQHWWTCAFTDTKLTLEMSYLSLCFVCVWLQNIKKNQNLNLISFPLLYAVKHLITSPERNKFAKYAIARSTGCPVAWPDLDEMEPVVPSCFTLRMQDSCAMKTCVDPPGEGWTCYESSHDLKRL